MKTLYFECNMGASGDMIMGALFDLCESKEAFLKTMNTLGLPGVQVHASSTKKCGIHGVKMQVHIHEHTHHDHEHTHHEHVHHDHEHTHHDQEHSHTTYQHMLAFIDQCAIPANVKEDAKAVYKMIGDAEALVHHTTLDQIHFHEVGTLDAIADVIGCCLLISMLHPNCILSSPVHTGYGFVKCDHGILPVPAPATAHILKGVPIYSGSIEGELCTPTGAALLKYFTTRFCSMPPFIVDAIGYGMGTKDFPTANCLRAYMGNLPVNETEEIAEICCNLDDMTPEAIGFATEFLLSQGALDVYTTSIGMKKGRPGILLTCLCPFSEKETFGKLLLIHTTTCGIRYHKRNRMTLESSYTSVNTPYGAICKKIYTGFGIQKEKPEYEDVKDAAQKTDIPFQTIWQSVL